MILQSCYHKQMSHLAPLYTHMYINIRSRRTQHWVSLLFHAQAIDATVSLSIDTRSNRLGGLLHTCTRLSVLSFSCAIDQKLTRHHQHAHSRCTRRLCENNKPSEWQSNLYDRRAKSTIRPTFYVRLSTGLDFTDSPLATFCGLLMTMERFKFEYESWLPPLIRASTLNKGCQHSLSNTPHLHMGVVLSPLFITMTSSHIQSSLRLGTKQYYFYMVSTADGVFDVCFNFKFWEFSSLTVSFLL